MEGLIYQAQIPQTFRILTRAIGLENHTQSLGMDAIIANYVELRYSGIQPLLLVEFDRIYSATN
jgi:hypothetical protein